MATYEDFSKLDIRVGTVVQAEEFPEAKKPALKLVIDFGADIGIKRSSAQITHLYNSENLLGKQVLGVVNFPPRKIGPFISEVLVLGVTNTDNAVVLVAPDNRVLNGQKLH